MIKETNLGMAKSAMSLLLDGRFHPSKQLAEHIVLDATTPGCFEATRLTAMDYRSITPWIQNLYFATT